MNAAIDSPDFWNRQADYLTVVHAFTSYYSEQAWKLAEVPTGARVLDIAAGAGALACIAAAAGASVLATDFAQGMVEAIDARRIPGLDAKVMDGQALGLPDASFDAAFSMFGIMLFPDWRAGLAEMARVLRPGGIACVGTWKNDAGAAANLLLARAVEEHFPGVNAPSPLAGMRELSDPARFDAAFEAVGIGRFRLHEVSSDFLVEAVMLEEPDRLFQFSPIWPELDAGQKEAIAQNLKIEAGQAGGAIRVPSPALIGIGERLR